MARLDLGEILDYGLTALGVGVLAATIGGVGLAPFARPTQNNEKCITVLVNVTGEPLLAQTGVHNVTERVNNDLMIGLANTTGNVGHPARTGGYSLQLGIVNISGSQHISVQDVFGVAYRADARATYTGCLIQIGAINFIEADQHGRGSRVYPLLNFRCAPTPAERAER